MRFSSHVLIAALSFVLRSFAAPTANLELIERADFVTSLQTSVAAMSSGVSDSLTTINSSTNSSNLMGTVGGIQQLVTSFTTGVNAIAPLMENPITEFSIEEIKVLIAVLEVYKNILSAVEDTVDSVVNTFFPGLVSFFRPFIMIWINVVKGFTAPFINFYTSLVVTLSGSPELAAEIGDYINEIQTILDNLLLAF